MRFLALPLTFSGLAKAQIALALCGWILAFAKPVLYEVPTYLAQT